MTSAAHASPWSSSSTRSSESSVSRPKNVGRVWSAALSIVTSASGRSSSGRSTRASLNSVTASDTLPQERGAHPHPDAEGGEAVAGARPFAHRGGELRDEPHAGGRERVTARDRAAVRVQALVVGRYAEALAPAQHLDCERLVELEGVDVVDRHTGPRQHLLCSGYWAEPHQLRLDARERELDKAQLRLEPVLLGRALRREQRHGRAVRQPGRVA